MGYVQFVGSWCSVPSSGIAVWRAIVVTACHRILQYWDNTLMGVEGALTGDRKRIIWFDWNSIRFVELLSIDLDKGFCGNNLNNYLLGRI